MITEQGFSRVRGVLRRRRLPIVAVAVATVAVSVVLIGRLEPRYRASAVVRALESQPNHDYVSPTVAEQVGERLKTLRLAMMARPVLAAVAQQQGLVDDKHPLDRVVDGMRSRMEVKVEGEDTFLITYEDGDPQHARDIVNGVAKEFMTVQVARREQIASATEKALAAEVARLKPEADKLEARVRDFKLAHYGALPEQQEQNLRLLDQTTMEINIQASNLDLENERRRQLISTSISPLRHQEETLLQELHQVNTRYLPDHPEVKRMQKEYDDTRAARIDEEKDLRKLAKSRNPEVVTLENEAQRTAAMLGGLRARQEEVRARVTETAKNGQALATLQADFDTVHQKYQAVVSRLREAELAAGLERGLSSLRYDLLEGATAPAGAVFPNRPLMAFGALILALVLSLSVGFALDRADSKIYAPAELTALNRPIELLACIPDLGSRTGTTRTERSA